MRFGAYGRRPLAVVLSAVMILSVAPVAVAGGSPTVATMATLVVDDDGVECPGAGYTTIQAAVDAAAPGDTIQVCPGTYNEGVDVDVSNLRIVGDPGDAAPGPGPDAPVLDGLNAETVGFEISDGTNNVTIEGFEVFNYTTGPSFRDNGVRGAPFDGATANDITVRDNEFRGFRVAVYSFGSATFYRWTVSNNVFVDNVESLILNQVVDPVIVNNRVFQPTVDPVRGLGWENAPGEVSTGVIRDNVVDLGSADGNTLTRRVSALAHLAQRENGVEDGTVIANNTVRNALSTGSVTAIEVSNRGFNTTSRELSVDNNTVENVTAGRIAYGIRYDRGGFSSVDTFRVDDNAIEVDATSGRIAYGVFFRGMDVANLTVLNNTLTTTPSGEGTTVGMDFDGNFVGNGPVVSGNVIDGYQESVRFSAGTTAGVFELSFNDFLNASEYAVNNFNDFQVVDARDNYWGSADGPGSRPLTNAPFADPVNSSALADGAGGNVSEGATAGVSNVRFDAFQTAPNRGATDVAEFDLTIDGTNSPAFAGGPVRVFVTVENVGTAIGSGPVNLTIDGTAEDGATVSLAPGESATLTLTWATSLRDVGVYTATVTTPDDSDTTTVRVVFPDFGAVDRGECDGDEPRGDDWTDGGQC